MSKHPMLKSSYVKITVKITHKKIIAALIHKALKYQEAVKLQWQVYAFQNTNVHLEAKFYHR